MLDIQSLLQPVSPDAPGGPNLDYSSAFTELERELRGKPERQIGDVIVASEDPDWASVIAKASALLKSSKDLRVAISLVRALIATDHYRGLAEGLDVVGRLVADYWPVLHPQLDEEDSDATARINAMAALTHREMLQAVRSARIVLAKGFGPVTLRSLEAPTVVQNGDGGPASSRGASAQAALDGIPLADLAEAAQWVDRCDNAARELEVSWSSHLDAGGPDFTELRRLLAQVNKMMKARMAERQPASVDGAAGAAGVDEGVRDAPAGQGAPRGELRSRDDVVRALDVICAYYARHEPSSPVPLLLERCKRLVTMSFLDIVKDMMPDGVSTIQTIAGKKND
jgi:type VI secretion system protein ImpA